jgi:integrase
MRFIPGRARPFDLDYQRLRLLWNRVRLHLGLKDVVIHSLRHTCASRLVQRGASIQYVKEWLGHKTLNMTMRYSHLAPTSLDSMVSLLEQQPTEKPRHLGIVEGGQS